MFGFIVVEEALVCRRETLLFSTTNGSFLVEKKVTVYCVDYQLIVKLAFV